MEFKKTALTITCIGALVLGLTGCGKKPELKEVKDFTGDGIQDVLMYEPGLESAVRGNYLFIGKDDGTFIRTHEEGHYGVKYFLSDDKVAYFFDGEFYRQSPKNK